MKSRQSKRREIRRGGWLHGGAVSNKKSSAVQQLTLDIDTWVDGYTYTKTILIATVGDFAHIDNLQSRLKRSIVIRTVHSEDSGDGALCQLLHILY